MGGVLVARGSMDFWPLLLVGTLGSTAGNYVWFWVGEKRSATSASSRSSRAGAAG